MDPLELRRRNALATGDVLATTGQEIEGPLPTIEVIDSVASLPLPDRRPEMIPGCSQAGSV